MEYPLALLKVTILMLLMSGLLISIFYHQAARIKAAASAGAAASAAARFLAEAAADLLTPWECQEDGIWWPRAEELATAVAVGRENVLGRVLPTDVDLRLDENCAIVVRVLARVDGVWAGLSAAAVSCAETVEHVLALPPPCEAVAVA